MNSQPNPKGAFTRIELLVVALILVLLLGVLVPATIQKKRSAQLGACVGNLKQVILAELLWVNDHETIYFQGEVSTNKGGSSENLRRGEFFQHFRCLSNELVVPRILVCPSDDRKAAKDFANLGNSNLSYFINMNAGPLARSGPSAWPDGVIGRLIVLGDRNVTNNTGARGGIISITESNCNQLRWNSRMHNSGNASQTSIGNVAFTDGGVGTVDSTNLQRPFKYEVTTVYGLFITNRLAIP